MSQSPPDILGKYQIIREIARSNDIVYEAYDPVMNRRVAVKELAVPGGSTDVQRQERIKRFLREAKAAGSLVHPNIVTIYDVDEQNGRFYLAMEFLDGSTLRKKIEREGFLGPEDAVETAIEVLKALHFAHQNGVIHRDVKPENIQILENGAVKLTDFGIARLTFEPNITMDGQVFGTPSYMSPEQINGREIDARSDIFSMGVALYEMVAGQKPFTGDSVVSITYAIMNAEPPQPAQANHTLWQVIQKAIDKSPVLRYGSAEEMISDLRQVLKSFHSAVIDPVVNTSQPPPSLVQPNPYSQPYTPYGTPNPMYQGIQQPGQGPVPPQHPGAPIMTPYGQAQPYGQVQPYGQAQPYGQPPQPMMPVYPTTPGHQVPYGQPITTPYGGGGGYPGMPYGAAPPPPSQIPVYYPPPPSRPLFSEETKATFGKFAIACITIAAMVLIGLFGIEQIGKAGSEVVRNSPSPAKQVSGGGGASAPSAGGAANSSPAPPERVPNQQEPAPVAVDVESLLREAQSLVNQGASDTSLDRRRDAWRRAGEKYSEAATGDPSREADVYEQAYYDFLNAANQMAGLGDISGARTALTQAESYAGTDAQKVNHLEGIRQNLGG